jgi:hypothetical protein
MTIQERKAVPIPQVEPRKPIPQQNLRIPGPTPVPSEVLKEMARPMINHRGPEFAAILQRVTARLQYFFQTTSPVLTYPASGTGGQEAAVANLFSPGDHVESPRDSDYRLHVSNSPGERLLTPASLRNA